MAEDPLDKAIREAQEAAGLIDTNAGRGGGNQGGGNQGGGGGGGNTDVDVDRLLLERFADQSGNFQESERTLEERLFKNQQAENEMMFGQQSDPTKEDEFRKGRSLSLLTNDDLTLLAKDKLFPDALKKTLGAGGITNEDRFLQTQSPSERSDQLIGLRDFQFKEDEEQRSIDDFMQDETTAQVGGLVGSAAIAIPSLIAAKGALVSYGVKGLATLVGDYAVGAGMNVVRMAVPHTTRQIPGKAFGLAVAKSVYDNLGGEEEIKKMPEEEVQEEVEKVMKTFEEKFELDPEQFNTHGFDVSMEDYQRVEPGTKSKIANTFDTVARDRAELMYSKGASDEDIKRSAKSTDAFAEWSARNP